MHSAWAVAVNSKRNKISKTYREILSLFIAFVMLISSLALCACSNSTAPLDKSKAGTVVSQSSDELTVIDQAGREVTVKKNPKTIALVYRVVIRFLLGLEQGDKIVGIGKTEDFLEEVQPSLKNCADVGLGVVDIEALAELNPELFIHKASDLETLEAVEKLGIPAVGIELETTEDITVALDILGKVCGAEEKASELINYYNNEIKQAEDLVSSLKDKDKKTAIIMGTSIGKVADSSMLQGVMLEKAGAINCASDIEASELWPTAGTEQIFSWNPDYIFITGSEEAVYSPEDIYKDKDWANLKAVKNKHIYVIPTELDSWEFPGIVSALGINYLIHTMYPELLSDEQLCNKVNEFYQLSYGRQFSREYLGY